MATITRLKNSAGEVSYRAQIRLAAFDSSTAKTFKASDYDGLSKTQARKAAEADAKAWADAREKELRTQAVRGEVKKDLTRLTVGDLIRHYLRDTEVRKLRSYGEIQRLLAWWLNQYDSGGKIEITGGSSHENGDDDALFGDKDTKKKKMSKGVKILDFGVLMLRDARDNKLTGIGPATKNRYVSALRSAWNWGRSAGLVPQERIWPPRMRLTEPRGRTRFLSDGELAALLKAAETDRVMRTAILVSVATGVRQGELLRLRWADVDLDGGKLTILESKNATPRAVHLAATAVEALRALKKAKVVSATHVFLIDGGRPLQKGLLETRWRKIRSAANLADLHWHDLRHSCASFLARKGASLLEIGSVLGHKSPSMTQRYSHLVQGAPVKGHAELDELLKGKS